MATTIASPEVNPTRIKKKRVQVTGVACRTSNSNSYSRSYNIGIRIPKKWKLFLRRNRLRDVERIAFPLGMSMATLFAQAMEMKDLASLDYLSTICTSAVRESLTNVYGQKFDAFALKFEKSFESTLNTFRLIRNSEVNSKANQAGNRKTSGFSEASLITECASRNNDVSEGCTLDSSQYFEPNEIHDDVPEGCTVESSQYFEVNEIDDDVTSLSGDRELAIPETVSSQLARRYQTTLSNPTVGCSIEKLAAAQERANELTSMKMALTVPLKCIEVQQKEVEIASKSKSNELKMVQLTLEVQKISLEAEKLKTRIEETKHGELHNMCADYLVTGLIIMSCCLCCGVYNFSLDKLRQLTESCYTPDQGIKSRVRQLFQIPSFNSGLQTLSCQFKVYSRMIFGGLMIGAIVLVLVRKPGFANKSMPITFILLLLAALCGYVGRFCVSSFGGGGDTWLTLWLILCFVHFFAIIFNSRLYLILYGAVEVCQGTNYKTVLPFWLRRLLFRLFLLLIPVCCGLLPFASASKWWGDHISHWIANLGSQLLNKMMPKNHE